MELERAMHQGIMCKTLTLVKPPGIIYVRILIVAHHARAQYIEAAEDRQNQD